MKKQLSKILIGLLSVGLMVSPLSVLATASSTVFSYTGATSTWTAPAGINGGITITVLGAKGAPFNGFAFTPAQGGVATGTLSVASSTGTFYFCVGGQGKDGSLLKPSVAGGFCGGGASGTGTDRAGSGGGGMSWFGPQPTFSSSSVYIVAGGGGGSSANNGGGQGDGGNGGGTVGIVGVTGTGAGGGPGTQSAGGAGGGGGASGTAGQGGKGQDSTEGGGGGGGGLFGGGGGAGTAGPGGGGGGGGSGFFQTGLTNLASSTGTNNATGSIALSYDWTAPVVSVHKIKGVGISH